ncbi:hypothetical protein P7K49_010699 [Saguinus oedipus]|uniref:Uncharacterized protein n=1 Tax=Saguinus oedipus TaxID=9490 RepID=A0ABQ9VNI7_SAGOE|nr:hypothetical protein P7K49_010699 [Saguinus oedipus]
MPPTTGPFLARSLSRPQAPKVHKEKHRQDVKGTNERGGPGERVRRAATPGSRGRTPSALFAWAARPLALNLWALGRAEGPAWNPRSLLLRFLAALALEREKRNPTPFCRPPLPSSFPPADEVEIQPGLECCRPVPAARDSYVATTLGTTTYTTVDSATFSISARLS